MIYIPCFNVLTLPDVSCYFRLDYLNGMSDQPVKAGDKVLFLMLKEQREGGEIEAEDIYPIAVRGVVESIEYHQPGQSGFHSGGGEELPPGDAHEAGLERPGPG